MKNREYMMTLDDEHLESVIYHLVNQDFNLADNIFDPTQSVTKWLSAEYDPKDKIWGVANNENDDAWWEENG